MSSGGIPESFKQPVRAVGAVYLPQADKIKHNIQQGEYGQAAIRSTTTAIQSPYLIETVRESVNAVKNGVKDPKSIQFLGAQSSKIESFHFIPDNVKANIAQTSAGKYITPCLDTFDKSLVETKFGEKVINAFDKSARIAGKGEEAVINGSNAAVNAGKILGRIPVLSVGVSSVLEAPKILKAAKNGDAAAQCGRSALNVAGCTVGSAVMGAICMPILPPFGGFVGAAVGGYVCGKIADKAGKMVFGKPKGESPKPA